MEKHFATAVYVYNPTIDKFLFINHKKIQKWLQPGGHIEKNENPEDCAVREVLEETNLKVKLVGKRLPRETDLIRPFGLQLNVIKEGHEHFDLIYLAVTNEVEFKLNEQETTGISWFSKDEIVSDSFDTFAAQKSWVIYFSDNIEEILK